MKRQYYLCMAFLLFAGCQDDNPSTVCHSDKSCASSEKCYEGTCYPNILCLPECDDGQKCVSGTCYGLSECVPSCDASEKCYEGTCYDQSVCKPNCSENEICNNGTCKPVDPTICEGTLCKDNMTYCADDGVWTTCREGTYCLFGHCIPGSVPCTSGECSEDGKSVCDGGAWVNCSSVEVCDNGACRLDESLTCPIGTCSEDRRYLCVHSEIAADTTDNTMDSTGKYIPCDAGYVCDAESTSCILKSTPENFNLWTTCRKDSDCAHGSCIKSLSTSYPLTSERYRLVHADYVPLHLLDERLDEDEGVCSADCSLDVNACNDISSNDAVSFQCQVVVKGDSPYPPKDTQGNALSLPFSLQLNEEDMSQSAFAALCRPVNVLSETYAPSMCTSCRSTSDCGKDEVCYEGMCYAECSSDITCPLMFSCVSPGEMKQSVCIPDSHACQECYDRDGDGQGYGHCRLSGVDCDDLDETVYYGNPAIVCSDETKDANCNGAIDQYEMLGPDKLRYHDDSEESYNCHACGSICVGSDKESERENVSGRCVHVKYIYDLNPESISEMIKSFYQLLYKDVNCETPFNKLPPKPHFTEEIYNIIYLDAQPEIPELNTDNIDTYKFICINECTPGYADCDGDMDNGCETQIAVYKDKRWHAKGKEDGEGSQKMLDYDRDGYPLLEGSIKLNDEDINADKFAQFCCPGKDGRCYADANTVFNRKSFWAPISIKNTKDLNSKMIQITEDTLNDCNDNDPAVYPNAKEVCDGKINDCLRQDIKDGADAVYVNENNEDRKLGEACTVYYGNDFSSTQCTDKNDGVVICDSKNNKMQCTQKCKICNKNDNGHNTDDPLECCGVDDNCDGIDDDCDGLVDEDYVETYVELKNTDPNSKEKCLSGIEICEGICRHGIKVCVSGKENEIALFDARPYDFYGDNVDSNCDGVDYDIKNAVFIAQSTSANSLCSGNDKGHDGSAQSPYAGFGVPGGGQLSNVFKELDLVSGKKFYHDIMIEENVGCVSEENCTSDKAEDECSETKDSCYFYNTWEKTPIIVPAVLPENRYTVTYKGGLTPEDAIQRYRDQKNTDGLSFDEFRKSYSEYYIIDDSHDEVYPPKEVVRIYGGWTHKLGDDSKGECTGNQWTPPTTSAKTTYEYYLNFEDYNKSDSKNSNKGSSLDKSLQSGALIYAYNNAPLSLKLSNMKFEFYGYAKGETTNQGEENKTTNPADTNDSYLVTGIDCRASGCSHLSLHHTDINVYAPSGINGEDGNFVESGMFANHKKGVDGRVYKTHKSNSDNSKEVISSLENYGTNRDNNKCHYELYKDPYWNLYTENKNLFSVSCPDGAQPYGGCGGILHSKHQIEGSTIFINQGGGCGGKGGSGVSGGASTSGAVNKGDGCDSSLPKLEDGYRGKNGEVGKGGCGGKNDEITLNFSLDSTSGRYKIQMKNFEKAHGKNGISGGGGSGGAVQRAYSRNGQADYYVIGGTGGVGGCGGAGGKGGGAGGSAVGISMVNPPRTSGKLACNDSAYNQLDCEKLKCDECKKLEYDSNNPGITEDEKSKCKELECDKFTSNKFEYDKFQYIDFEFVDSTINAVAGAGGAGGKGQSGFAGGSGSRRAGYTEENLVNTDMHCLLAGGGGCGGAGGGGGSGADGKAGFAYGIFITNPHYHDKNLKNDPDYQKKQYFKDCGILAGSATFNAILGTDKVKVELKEHGADGKQGGNAKVLELKKDESAYADDNENNTEEGRCSLSSGYGLPGGGGGYRMDEITDQGGSSSQCGSPSSKEKARGSSLYFFNPDIK